MINQNEPGTQLGNVFHVVAGEQNRGFITFVIVQNELPDFLLHQDVQADGSGSREAVVVAS